MKTQCKKVRVFDVDIDAVTTESLPLIVEEMIAANSNLVLAPVNIDIMNKAYEQPLLKQFLQQSDVVHSDGAGVVLGTRLMGDPLPHRVTSVNLIWNLCRRWQDGQHSFYFLGGPEGVAEKAAAAIHAQYPGVRIVGCHRGHLSPDEELKVIEDIERTRPDILCVGFGTPYQEEFIVRHREKLAFVPVIWSVGALTSHIAQIRRRAPAFMRKYGMEWLWRFMQEPVRLFDRYIIGNPRFLWRVWRENR